MVGLMAGIAILMILSTVATQAWVDVVRRDNEAEMMFRAQEIVRALRKYQKDPTKGGNLPHEFEKLMEPGGKGQYFLRRMYKDPLVKGGQWGVLFAGMGGGVVDPNNSEQGELDLFGNPLLKPQEGEGAMAGQMAIQGLPLAGVKSLCKEKPFRIYKEQTEYSRWLFTVYDLDMVQPAVPVPGGGPIPQPAQPGGGGLRLPGAGNTPVDPNKTP